MIVDGSLVIDGVVIALLAITIFYAIRLERKLHGLRGAQAALAGVIVELNTAAARAEAGIQGLKATADSSGGVLDERIRRARAMSDELAILVQSGTRLADRIDAIRAANGAPSRSAVSPRSDFVQPPARAFGGKR